MLESFRTHSAKSSLPCVSERGMTYIMSKCYCFRKILVQAKRPGYGPGVLRHFKGMCKPGPVVVTLGSKEDLGLVLQSPE